MPTTNITIRMDSDIKARAEHLFDELGMNMSTAFNIFVRQTLRDGGIPFRITTDTPNQETLKAMMETEQIANDPTITGYSNVENLLTVLK